MHANQQWDVIVAGAGAAGLMAAERAAACGCRTLLLEKNRKAGVKILMSGGTRCNVTHDTDARGIVQAFGPHGRFLHSALARLGPREVASLFRDEGVPTKVEAGGKVFPVSDTAVDVQQALLRRLQRAGAMLQLDAAVQSIAKEATQFQVTTSQGVFVAPCLIITSGGLSYPGCGTTGDGYAWARQFGHTIVPTVPALAPVRCDSDWVRELQGLTLDDVLLQVRISESTPTAASSPSGGETTTSPATSPLTSASGGSASRPPRKKTPPPSCRSGMVFTHFGVSGPAPMNLSRHVEQAGATARVELICDFFPDENEEQLWGRLRSECQRHGRRQVSSVLATMMFQRLADVLLRQSRVNPSKNAGEVSNAELRQIVSALKRQSLPISGTLGYPKAEVTSGGVVLEEVDSSTMESKRVSGLYFAGEILDLDGPIGGYNFQAAFSTGWAAGLHAGTCRDLRSAT